MKKLNENTNTNTAETTTTETKKSRFDIALDEVIEESTPTTLLDLLKCVIEKYNDSILDNVPTRFIFSDLKKLCDEVNKDYERCFIADFLRQAKKDKKTAINSLLSSFNFPQAAIIEEKNGTATLKADRLKLFDFAKLEKAYQLEYSEEIDQNGKKIPNEGVTIFGALRIVGLTNAFINNLVSDNFEKVDVDKMSLEKIVIDNEKIFDENDNKAFESNSMNNLEKQLNIIVRLIGFDNIKLLKRDVKVLKIVAQQIRIDSKTATHKIKRAQYLKFANHIFARIKEYVESEFINAFYA